MTEPRYFHVIMPVGSDPGWHVRRAAIKRSADRNGIEVRFPQYLTHAPAFRLDDLKQELANALFVLADLTLERPSCYYEVGLAEALCVTLRLVAEYGTPIHQTAMRGDVRYYRDIDDLERIVAEIIQEVARSRLGANA